MLIFLLPWKHNNDCRCSSFIIKYPDFVVLPLVPLCRGEAGLLVTPRYGYFRNLLPLVSVVLGSTVQSNGGCGREVKKRVQAGWNGWRRMSGVICNRRVPPRVKGKVYKVAVRSTMLYGLETVALTKRQEAKMEVAELKMLRFSLGVTRMDKIRNDKIRNEYIKGTAQVGWFGEETREASQRFLDLYGGKVMGIYWEKDAQDGVARKEETGKAKKEVYGCGEEDMAEVEVTEIGTTGDGKSAVATPDGKSRKKKNSVVGWPFLSAFLPSSSAFLRSIFTQSSHLSCGLLRVFFSWLEKFIHLYRKSLHSTKSQYRHCTCF